MNVRVQLPTNFSRGLFYLLGKDDTGANLDLLSRCFEVRDARSQLLANALDCLLQCDLIKADDCECRIVTVHSNSVARSHLADQPLSVELSHAPPLSEWDSLQLLEQISLDNVQP